MITTHGTNGCSGNEVKALNGKLTTIPCQLNDHKNVDVQSRERMISGFRLSFQISDEIVPLLFLLQTREHHFRARNVLLWVCQVRVQRRLSPFNPFLLIGIGVRKSWRAARGSSPHSKEIWPRLVLSAALHSVALGASLDEDFLSFFCVTHFFVD